MGISSENACGWFSSDEIELSRFVLEPCISDGDGLSRSVVS
jgi:hypothetical protein